MASVQAGAGHQSNSVITQGLSTASNNSPLESFFGPYQGTAESLRADDRLAHETYNLPEAYKGRNKFLEEVLDFKIRKEDEFYTRDLLPWEFTDDLHVAWEIFSFNRTLADLEPHQGVPRYVSAQSEQHTDNLLRRGLAFIIEHGFYKTSRGKRHFALNLQQISDAVHTTCYFGVIHSLLSGQNYYKEWNRRYGRQANRVNDLFDMEKRRWACVQKEVNGLYLLDAELKHELRKEGVVPNLWVFPDKMGIYVNMVGEHQMDYDKRGPLANENRERGDLKATFRGLPVFEAQSFDVDFTGEPIDLMTRERQCGEWFWCKAGDQIAIYSADSDNWEIMNGEDGEELDNKAMDLTKVPDLTPEGMNADGPVEDGYLLFRPFQTYRMASAILAKGGTETGSTFHGHHDFMLSDDVVRKVHVGHYTFYSKAVVKRPKNYVIVEDVFAQGYVGGEGSDLFDLKSEDDQKIFKQLLATGEFGRGGPSIMAFKCKRKPKNSIVDITGSFSPSVYEKLRENGSNREHYAGQRVAYEKLGLDILDMYKERAEDEFLNRVKRLNTVCHRGMQLEAGKDGVYVPTQLNTGHWGPNVYPGVRKVREGQNSFIENQNWSKKMIMKVGEFNTTIVGASNGISDEQREAYKKTIKQLEEDLKKAKEKNNEGDGASISSTTVIDGSAIRSLKKKGKR